MIVLDTNVSEAMKPEPNPAVLACLNDQAAETLYISSVTLAELLFGIQALPRGRRRDQLDGALNALLELFSARGIHIEHIQPGKPQQNAYVERFNRTVRYEWLSQYHWCDLDEVREFATQWMWRYNHERPNMALGGITPKQRLAMAA